MPAEGKQRLPADVTSFVGRRHELAEGKRLLSAGRLLTLSGPGGVGKSRLAVRIAAEKSRAFRDGVRFVELDALHDPDLFPQFVAGVFGLRETATDPTARLAGHLTDKQLLLVLDNCEHLVEPCSTLLSKLLGAAPGLKVLATSRHVLGADGEFVFPVPPLSVPEPGSNGDLVHYSAVSLFVDRAKAARAGFELDSENRDSVAGICRRLDGIPLAIELAAVRIRAFSPEQLLSRLDDSFHLLTTTSASRPPRQQTLQTTLDWSFGLCSSKERLLWSYLSVFPGDFDVEAAEEICCSDGVDKEEIFDLVASLVDKSILIVSPQATGDGKHARYDMLETIRQYGRARLIESGEEKALQARHENYYARLAARGPYDYFTAREGEWFRKLLLESANLRVAMEFCLTDRGMAHSAVEIATQLKRYWIACGFLREGYRFLRRALDKYKEPTNSRADALATCGFLGGLLGEPERATAMLDEASRLVQRLGNKPTLADIIFYRGVIQLNYGDTDGALALTKESVARHKALNSVSPLFEPLYVLGLFAFSRSDPRVYQISDELLDWTEKLETQWSRAYARYLVGIRHWRDGKLDMATEKLQSGIELARLTNDQTVIAFCISGLACVAAAKRAHERAAQLLGAADTAWQLSGEKTFQAMVRQFSVLDCENELRKILGESGFCSAFDSGAAWPFEEAIENAVDKRNVLVTVRSPTNAADGLTPRELDVARLVGKGLTNKAIAAQLVISRRTVETHVEHVLDKLGFGRRAQIVGWVVEHERGES